jgi:GT2 family glycosyltransferase
MTESKQKAVDVTAHSVSVVIVSWCRPNYVQSCLQRLCALSPGPQEIVVVDASPDDETQSVVSAFPEVTYVPFPGGAGHMTTSRNVGLLHVSGDVIAFLDDDTVVHDGWLEGVVSTFGDETVGALAGRTCNGHPGENVEGVDEIGRLLPDGRLTGFFAANPGHEIDVAHGIGANMAFRRHVLAELGGFRDDFPGAALREDTDMFFRISSIGYRIVFSPRAAVDHLGAPHVRGRRFDFRYVFWSRLNHVLLLGRNFGLGSTYLRAWVRGELGRVVGAHHPNPLRRATRVLLGVCAIVAGGLSTAFKAGWRSTEPRRYDDVGNEVRSHLLGPYSPNRIRSCL